MLIALCTRSDLTTAFSFVASPDEARRLAEEAFYLHGEDASGRVFWKPRPAPSRSEFESGGLVVSYDRSALGAQGDSTAVSSLRRLTPSGRRDRLLMLGEDAEELLVLVSDEVARRIQAAKGYSDAQLEHLRQRMRRAVDAPWPKP